MGFKIISFALLWFPVDAKLTGINSVVDLSHWNSRVDFKQVKQSGISGVIHKATQGLTYVDKEYAKRKTEAEKNGIRWGAYHFADGTAGDKQAYHFLKIVGDDPNILLALDFESNSYGSNVNLSVAEDIVRTIYQEKNRYPLVYGSAFLKEMVGGTNSILLKCPLWIAQWGPRPVIPENTWKTWTLWQYTNGVRGPEPHTVRGIGKVDRDTINSEVYQSVDLMWSQAGYD